MENKDLEWIENIEPIIHFENLVFNPHSLGLGGVQSSGNFPINGKWYSVIGGLGGFYGDGVNTFEVWGDNMDEPIGWLTKDEVEQWLLEMQSTK
jgi:hypothetical protein